ncbi:HmuY family protein [Chryseobacterium tructae]|uniref:HmuY family protein n=1 Tax=Chryseobacterium tructae TaxID=1037380 RepID=A0ABV7Y138_9FLAO|nr:HmuY family protein [Chryseobacterium tructae]MDN3693999.1 HmuY family protein [Chryseobacterium tructae]
MKYLKILSLLSIMAATQSCLSADEDPVAVRPMTGSEVNVTIGGATEPNQVWIDLSEFENPSINKRTDWDLGFYTGDDFRVIMNGSLAMTVIKIPNATDLGKVKEKNVESLMEIAQVGTFDAENLKYIDNPNGNFLTQTSGFETIKENDADNPIYLVNMGREMPAAGNVPAGAVSLSGDARGWKKVQIVRAQNGYKIRYADLNAESTNIKEYIIAKDTEYNFAFFNLKTGTPVKIQPKKKKWDLAFTTFTNEVFISPGNSAGSYFYADFIVTNTLNGVGAYQVNVTGSLDDAYSAFKLKDVDANKFVFNDHRAIGDKWRTTTGTSANPVPFVYSDRFFVLKDAEGFYFKLRFNTMKNSKSGERGFTNFEFDPL